MQIAARVQLANFCEQPRVHHRVEALFDGAYSCSRSLGTHAYERTSNRRWRLRRVQPVTVRPSADAPESIAGRHRPAGRAWQRPDRAPRAGVHCRPATQCSCSVDGRPHVGIRRRHIRQPRRNARKSIVPDQAAACRSRPRSPAARRTNCLAEYACSGSRTSTRRMRMPTALQDGFMPSMPRYTIAESTLTISRVALRQALNSLPAGRPENQWIGGERCGSAELIVRAKTSGSRCRDSRTSRSGGRLH